MNQKNSLYENAKYYDIAFGYRNFKKDTDFLIKIFKKHIKKEPKSFLEIAAGPGRYVLEFARRNIVSSGLDLQKEMKLYTLDKANKENLQIDYYIGNMISYKTPKKFDFIGTFLNSLAYILKPQDLIAHLKTISKNLNSNGIYFLEFIHPKEFFESFHKSNEFLKTWQQKKGDITVDINWNDHINEFDYINFISKIDIEIKYKNKNKKGSIRDSHLQKVYTFCELQSLIESSKVFKIVDTFGDFDEKISLQNKKAWRMLLVLKAKAD